jgi:signal peptidase I
MLDLVTFFGVMDLDRRTQMRALIITLAVIASATIHAQSQTFQRGEQVRVKAPTAPSHPQATPLLLKVVAVPKDRIRLDDSAVYVNDVAVTGFTQDFLARVAHTPGQTPQTVPEGHYFVMGEQRANQNISEYWGQHSEGSLERAR